MKGVWHELESRLLILIIVSTVTSARLFNGIFSLRTYVIIVVLYFSASALMNMI